MLKFSRKNFEHIRKIAHDLLFGNDEFLHEKYTRLYGSNENEIRIEKFKKKVLRRYIAVAIVFVSVIAVNISSYSGNESNKFLCEKDGKLYVIRPEEGETPVYLDMTAEVKTKTGATVVKDMQVVVKPYKREEVEEKSEDKASYESEEERIMRSIDSAADSVNSNLNSREVVLKDTLESGEKIIWKKDRKSEMPPLLAGFTVIMILIIKSRYSSISKEEKIACESVVRELPDFINSLVMLLNAGEVLTTAFLTIICDREKKDRIEDSYFYKQLYAIAVKIRNSNATLGDELRDFARRSGVKELIRVSNIVNDNILMGSDLVDKLSKESELLWFARKKQSEEKGRIAETKMTFPLMILLLVLMLITVAPVMLKM